MQDPFYCLIHRVPIPGSDTTAAPDLCPGCVSAGITNRHFAKGLAAKRAHCQHFRWFPIIISNLQRPGHVEELISLRAKHDHGFQYSTEIKAPGWVNTAVIVGAQRTHWPDYIIWKKSYSHCQMRVVIIMLP